jgi:hypothetical protein
VAAASSLRVAAQALSAAALLGCTGLGSVSSVSAAPLSCTVTAPSRVAVGQPVPLQWTVHNTGTQAVDFLAWGTPFEGWFAPYVGVRRGNRLLDYGGPSAKRGDPRAAEYVHLEPGQSRQAVVELGLVFDLRPSGRYQVQPQISLHDVVTAGQGAVPRPRAQHAGQPLACPTVEFIVES